MSTLKSSAEDLTINADGGSSDIKFQINAVEKASINSSGLLTSTTIDATALTGNLPAIDGSSLTGVGGGKVLQVLQDVKTAETDLATDTFTDISGFSQVITPASSSNKVLVNVNIGGVGKHSSLVQGYLQIMRSISGGADTAVHVFTRSSVNTNEIDNFFASHESCSFLDSPSTTSATTYKVQFKRHSAVGYWRMNCNTGTNDVTSTLTLMEIGA